MSRRLLAAVVLAAVVVVPSAAWAAGSKPLEPKSNAPADPEPVKTPEEIAIDHYNFGLTYRDKAWKLEDKAAAAANEKARMKAESKAQKTWTKAVREFESATGNNPVFFQAYGSLGYALRKTGDFESSLIAYDRALELEPTYGEAIEYRAEAYLGLDRVEDAKGAYIQLFSGARELADELLEAMKKYVEHRRTDGGVDAASLDAFSEWVTEREEIANQTASVSELRDRDW